ncbi:hypothetical protein [Nocardioides dongkuii]|uniref:hypothetical protein n=1 Tax=Nocardioides dongkuii TaxID=2760089 RepID=UPI001C706D15|nr:hypothetical protein [Nocardioides dongkuii]
MDEKTPRQRPFRERWSVILFLVIGLAICVALIVWQLSDVEVDETPEGPGTGTGTGSAPAFVGAP